MEQLSRHATVLNVCLAAACLGHMLLYAWCAKASAGTHLQHGSTHGVQRDAQLRTCSMATVEERSTSKAADNGDAAHNTANDGSHANAC